MNSDFLILRNIYENKEISQRKIANALEISLGKVNQITKSLEEKKYIYVDNGYIVTEEGRDYLEKYKINTAIILANENLIKDQNGIYVPLGIKKINDFSLIEKQIIDLKNSGIDNIYLIAGNLIETYEYLIDKYSINFIFDKDYEEIGTGSKILKVREICEENDCYILASNILSKENLFHNYEIESFIYGYYKKDLEDSVKLVYNVQNVLFGEEDGGENDYAKSQVVFLKKEYSKSLFKLLKAYADLSSAKKLSYDEILIRNLDILNEIYVYKLREGIYDNILTNNDIKKYENKIKINSFPSFFVTQSFGINEKKIKNIKEVDNQDFDNVYSFNIEKKSLENKIFLLRDYDLVNTIGRDIEKEKILYENLNKDERFEKVLFIDNEFRTISEDFVGKRNINIREENERKVVLHFLRKMHNDKIDIKNELDINEVVDNYIECINRNKINVLYQDFKENVFMVKKLIYYILGTKRPKVVCKCFIGKNDICFTENGLRIINVRSIALFDPLIDIASLTTILNFSPNEMNKILEEYQNMVDVENIAMQDIDDEKAKQIIISLMGVLYFIQSMQIYIRENLLNESFEDEGFKKYHLYKICLNYMKNVLL